MNKKQKIIIIICAGFAFLIIVMGLVALSFIFAQGVKEIQNIRNINKNYDKEKQKYFAKYHSLKENSIKRVTLYDRYGRAVYATINDPALLTEFASSLNSIEYYQPNHPMYKKQFYSVIDLKEGKSLELMICFDDCNPYAFLSFVRQSGNTTSYFGEAKSKALFTWFKKNKDLIADKKQPPATNSTQK